jgi:hypothetical protein
MSVMKPSFHFWDPKNSQNRYMEDGVDDGAVDETFPQRLHGPVSGVLPSVVQCVFVRNWR